MYRIEFRELPIMWVACHTFWTLYEDDWLIGELHGLATDRETGMSQAVGTPRDVLRAWPYPMMGQEQKMKPKNGGFSGLYALDQASKVVFKGSKEEAGDLGSRACRSTGAQRSGHHVSHSRRTTLRAGHGQQQQCVPDVRGRDGAADAGSRGDDAAW
jgi:hypothetical protein